MNRRQFLVGASTVGIGGAAGCLSPTTETPTSLNLEYTLDNEDDEPYRFRMFVLESEPEALRVTYEDGTNENVPVDPIAALPPEAIEGAVALEPVTEPAQSLSYRLTPGSGVSGEFEDVRRGSILLYVVQRPDDRSPLRSHGAFSCGEDPDAMAVSLRVRNDGGMDSSALCGTGLG